MNVLNAVRASGIRTIIFDDNAISTICNRCGCEIDLSDANYAGPELPLWEGATLCNDCYAAERDALQSTKEARPVSCEHDPAGYEVDPKTGHVWCFKCQPAWSPTLAWAAVEVQRQLAANRTCATCGKVADVGYHTTCDYCGRPVCGVCAVQLEGCAFCPTCPRELPF